MTDHAGLSERQRLRASDEDRDRAADRIRVAVADGRLDLTELDERLADVYAARTQVELDLIGRDLPEPGRTAGLMVDRAPTSRFALGVFGWFQRRGRWVAPAEFASLSMFGGGEIDLTDARFTARETKIRAFALWGGTDIVVPDDIEVVVRGFGLFGVYDKSAAQPGVPGAPRVVVEGLAAFGAVVTRSKRSDD